jgi:hypothetical protein
VTPEELARIRREDEERQRQQAKYVAEFWARRGGYPTSLWRRIRLLKTREADTKALSLYLFARMRLDSIAATRDDSDEWKAAVIFQLAGLPDDQVASLCETGHLRLAQEDGG